MSEGAERDKAEKKDHILRWLDLFSQVKGFNQVKLAPITNRRILIWEMSDLL